MASNHLMPEMSHVNASSGLSPILTPTRGPATAEDLFGSIVRDIMTRKVVVVEAVDTLRFAATILAQKGVSGVPVLGKEGAVVGVLSEKDIIRALHQKGGLSSPGSLFQLILEPSEARRKDMLSRSLHILDNTLVSQVMTSPAKVIGPDVPTLEAARQMLAARINRLPVVEKGKLVGIVTRKDVLTMTSGSV